MLSNRTLGNGAIVVGCMLCLVAFATFVGGPTVVQGHCRRYCWAYELSAWLFGNAGAAAFAGAVWLCLAGAFFWVGFRIRRAQ